MKTKRSTLLQTVAFLTGMTLAGGCTSAPGVQAQQSQSQSQNQEQTTVVSTDSSTQSQSEQVASPVFDETNGNPNSYANMASALEGLPDYAIGEDGLFQMVNTDYYYNENWYKGYAGMFTPEDIAGKTIGGYPVELPLQIYGSWSSVGEEYFERVEDEHFGLMPKSSLYRNKLDWLRIEYQNYTEQTPYYEFDQEFRDMIVADDSLTTDQKLELIIKNHKGFIRNLDIGDLAMDTASELTKIEAEEMFYDMYGEDEFSTNPFTYYNGKEGEVRSFERVFLYDDNIFISYDSNSFGKDTGERFVEDIISSFEILKHRLPLIYDNILAPSDDNYSQINLIDSRHNAAATSYFSSERGRIVFYPTYVNFADRYDTNETNEIILSTIMHESIHNSIKSEKMQNFEYGDERFRNIVEIFEEDGGKSEILTTSSQVFLDEILNMSYSGGSLDAISVWYGVYNREDIWNGKDPMDYFIRIIDNRLGQ